MRSKETEADYRYFREPDLLPIRLDDEWKQAILKDFPELPLARRSRFIEQYGLPEYDAEILTAERGLSDYFEQAVSAYHGNSGANRDSAGVLRDSAGVLRDPKKVSNWLMNDVLRMINELGVAPDQMKLTPAYLAEVIRLVDAGTINSNTGKALLVKVNESGHSPSALIDAEGLARVSDDSAIRAVVDEVLAESPKEIETYRNGKTTLLGWFVGQVMKKMRGKADPNVARRILEEKLTADG